jgi:hypothetical protein
MSEWSMTATQRCTEFRRICAAVMRGSAWLGWVNNSLDLRSAFRQGTFTPEFFPFSG